MNAPDKREDDKTIPDDDRLLRRVSSKQIWLDGGVARPTSAVFKTEHLSVNIGSLMIEQGRPLAATLDAYPQDFLIAIRAREVRKYPYPIVKDTDPPNDPAHGLIIGKKSGSFANAMVRCHEWIVSPESD